MDITIYFFFNLSLIIILLFILILYIGCSNNLKSYIIFSTIFSFISLVICFILPYRFNDGIILDLRLIPFTIGGLYVGIGPLLGLFIIIVRGIYGLNSGFFYTSIMIVIFSLIFWKMSPWFLKKTSKSRVIIATGMSLIISIFLIIFFELNQQPYPVFDTVFDIVFGYLIIQPLGVAIIAIIIEIVCKSLYLRRHLVKTKRLEVVEKMAAAISHEIRNPLTAAIGFVQLMQDETITKDKSDQYLSILKSELNSAEKVIQNFLNFSKPQIETIELLDVNEELQFVVNTLQPLAKKSMVTIDTKFEATIQIMGDRQSFHQCFVNIIKNSIEAMDDGGTITIEVESSQTNHLIRIQDTGKGMTAEQIERLGEPYYSTKGESGTGLGIMVAYNIVRAMNGTISVKSEVGNGTTFEFAFPTEGFKIS